MKAWRAEIGIFQKCGSKIWGGHLIYNFLRNGCVRVKKQISEDDQKTTFFKKPNYTSKYDFYLKFYEKYLNLFFSNTETFSLELSLSGIFIHACENSEYYGSLILWPDTAVF